MFVFCVLERKYHDNLEVHMWVRLNSEKVEVGDHHGEGFVS